MPTTAPNRTIQSSRLMRQSPEPLATSLRQGYGRQAKRHRGFPGSSTVSQVERADPSALIERNRTSALRSGRSTGAKAAEHGSSEVTREDRQERDEHDEAAEDEQVDPAPGFE